VCVRKLADLPDVTLARRFGDVLEGEAIEHKIEVGASGAELWILRDSEVEAARELLGAWQADPAAERFKAAARKAESSRRARRARDARLEQSRERADRADKPLRVGPVLIATLAISAALTLLGVPSLDALQGAIVELPDTSRVEWAFIDSLPILSGPDGAYVPYLYDVRHGQVWRLVTPIFVHVGGLFHLFFNGYWMLDFGKQIETRKGSLYLLALVLGLAVASNLAQYTVGWAMIDLEAVAAGQPLSFAIGPIYLGGPSGGGLSGVLYGLFGYIWAKSSLDKFSGLGVSSSTVGILVVWLLICFTGAVGPVANLAHLGGLVAGVLWGGVSHRIRKSW
jgi:GlpG protein